MVADSFGSFECDAVKVRKGQRTTILNLLINVGKAHK